MSDEHSSPIKNWKQLLVVVVLSFLIPIVLIAFLTQLVTGQLHGTTANDSAVISRIRPVGEFVMAEGGANAGQRSGEEVYGLVCKSCHDAGLAGAPKFGDKSAWTTRIAQGEKTTVEHAIKGIRAMPPKGGNPDLTDDEVHRAVVHMANAVGANWKAPAVAAGTTAAATPEPGKSSSAASGAATTAATTQMAAATPASTPTSAPGSTPAASTSAGKPDGKKVYESVCAVCHAAGIAGAPKFGDKAAWAPRIKQGTDTLHASAIKGKGAMPAKGGNTALADADVKAAVDYMVGAAK